MSSVYEWNDYSKNLKREVQKQKILRYEKAEERSSEFQENASTCCLQQRVQGSLQKVMSFSDSVSSRRKSTLSW